ncbi:type 2 periplasmic-binding domain-containing protein, partial [Longispora fulva]
NQLQFEEVGTIEGAIEALKAGKAGYFLWEHFTTKPFVDKGVFRRLADCPTPWPCFVIAVRKEFLENYSTVLLMLKILNSVTQNFKEIPGIATALSKKYDQKKTDIL